MCKTGDDVSALVQAFGGLTAMARALGYAHPSTVQGWRQRGAIPRWRIYEIRHSAVVRSNPAVRAILDRLDPKDPTGCRYIAGDTKAEWSYCNQPQQKGSPYCPQHHALCRVAPDDAEAIAELERAAAMPGRERF